MDYHQNARLTIHSREQLAKIVLEQGLTLSLAAAGGGVASGWMAPAGTPDPKGFAEGFTLHKKGSDEVLAVQRGGQWTKP